MALVPEIISLGSQTAAFLVAIDKGWYQAGIELEQLKGSLQTCQSNISNWTALLRAHAVSDPTIRETLKQAAEQLQAEQVRYQKHQEKKGCMHCWIKTRRILVPTPLTDRINNVTATLAQLEQNLADIPRRNNLLEEALPYRPMELSFERDERYVPLEVSVKEVREALEVKAERLAILHGGPGLGKSSLARYMALWYQDGQPRDSSTTYFPDGVFFLSCGRHVDVKQKRLQLLQNMGTPFRPFSLGALQSNAAGDPPMDSYDDSHVFKKFEASLKQKDVLVILDDVWEPQVLTSNSGLVIHGCHVKYLVTTQNADLCPWDRCSNLSIQKVDMEIGRTMLARHMELGWDDFPIKWKAYADKIIQQTDDNPLALSSVARAVKRGRSWKEIDEKDWKKVHDSLIDLLLNTEFFHADGAQKNVKAAFMLALEAIESKTLDLLILTSICVESPDGIPEEVFKLFYKHLHGSIAGFQPCAIDAEKWSLVQLQQLYPTLPTPVTAWFMHGLRRQVLQQGKKEEIEKILDRLVLETGQNDFTDAHLVSALCVTYGDERFLGKRAAERLGISRESKAAKMKEVRPLVGLFHAGSTNDTEQKIHGWATKVFLKFFWSETMDYASLRDLLTADETFPLTCEAIENHPLVPGQGRSMLQMLTSRLSPDVDSVLLKITANTVMSLTFVDGNSEAMVKDIPESFQQLVTLSASSANPDVQHTATLALARLSSVEESRKAISAVPDIALVLVQLLGEDVEPHLQELSARTLGNLAHEEENMLRIAAIPNAMQKLVQLIDEDCAPMVKYEAAFALGNLACARENKLAIAKIPNSLHRLVQLIGEDVPSDTQYEAARALGILAEIEETRHSIIAIPGSLSRLVELIHEDVKPNIQRRAANAVTNLARTVAIAGKIGAVPMSLERLVHLIREDVLPDLQIEAMRALVSLSCGKENKVPIIAIPFSLQRFVHFLAEDARPDIQVEASRVLGNLAKEEENRLPIAAIPNCLERLVRLTGEGFESQIKYAAARALANLAVADENRVPIASIPECIENLVSLMLDDEAPATQEEAVRVIEILAFRDENKLPIGNVPGSLNALVHLIGDKVDPDTQQHAANALVNLASVNENKIPIAKVGNALRRLVELIGAGVRRDIQLSAIGVLVNLSCAAENVLPIAAVPDSLQRLVSLLDDDEEPDIQVEAARALGNLAKKKSTRMAIAEISQSLHRLVRLIPKDASPNIKYGVAYTLGNLAYSNDTRVPIAAIPDALQRLVELIDEGEESSIQEEAARTLGNLAKAEDNRVSMAKIPNLLHRLVQLIGEHVSPKTQYKASNALRNLALAVENKVAIAEVPGSLHSLVLLMGEDVEPYIQKEAAAALTNLIFEAPENRVALEAIPGALNRLAHSTE